MSIEENPSTQQLSSAQVKRRLQRMDNEDFEHFVADLWERRGWQTEVSQKSRDKSLDVLAEKTDPYRQRHAIQAKRYQENNRVGGPKISEYASLRDQFEADAAVVITTSGYTKDARERAETLNVKLIDGDDLVGQVEQLDAYDIVDKYSSAPLGDEQVGQSARGSGKTVSANPSLNFGLTSLPGISLDRNWAKITAYSAALGTIAFIIIGSLSPETTNPILNIIGVTGALIWLGALVVTPVGLYLDMKAIRRSTIPWNPRPLYYMLGILFTGWFGIIFYFYRRGKHIGDAKDASSENIKAESN